MVDTPDALLLVPFAVGHIQLQCVMYALGLSHANAQPGSARIPRVDSYRQDLHPAARRSDEVRIARVVAAAAPVRELVKGDPKILKYVDAPMGVGEFLASRGFEYSLVESQGEALVVIVQRT